MGKKKNKRNGSTRIKKTPILGPTILPDIKITSEPQSLTIPDDNQKELKEKQQSIEINEEKLEEELDSRDVVGYEVGLSTDSIEGLNQKTKEAGSMILYINNPTRLARNDWVLWVINRMFRPFDINQMKEPSLHILDLSEDKVPPWLVPTQPYYCKKSHHRGYDESFTDDPKSKIIYTDTKSEGESFLYRLMPHTQVYAIHQAYALVFLLDVSSSLATMDPFGKQVLTDQVLVNFKKVLLGVLQRFTIPTPEHFSQSPILPDLCISVLADQSQLLPTQLGGDEEYHDPTQVLLHNVQLTLNNVDQVLNQIAQRLKELQGIMAEGFRSLGQLHSPFPVPISSYLGQNTGNSSLLELGLLTMKLLPSHAAPVMILITDGIAEFGHTHLGSGLRGLAREGIQLIVIQIGNSMGFSPACNLGYVPDNEALRFLALSTGGKFLYASDCPNLDYESDHKAETFNYPNFYHRLLLLHHAQFQRPKYMTRHLTTYLGAERAGDVGKEKLVIPLPNHQPHDVSDMDPAFPWTADSSPPVTNYVLSRYRDYVLPLEASSILNARLREGFYIEKIGLAGPKDQRPDKIQINLALNWLPNVVIQYRIRALLPPELRPGQSSQPAVKKYLRIELNIYAAYSFAYDFVNFESNLTFPNPSLLDANIIGLHDYLKGIFATDDSLKLLSTLAQKFPALKAPKYMQAPLYIRPELIAKLDLEAVKAMWSSFEKDKSKFVSNGLFDSHVLIFSLVSSKPFNNQSAKSSEIKPCLTDFQHIFMDYHHYIQVDDNTYVRFLNAHKLGQSSFPSFCVLRLAMIADSLIWARLAFVNASYHVRDKIYHQHLRLNHDIVANGLTFTMKNCVRPLQNLLVDSDLNFSDVLPKPFKGIPKLSKTLLRSKSQDWLAKHTFDQYFPTHRHPSISDLTFSLLMKAKLKQGLIQVCQRDHAVLFYKELTSPWDGLLRSFGVQYQVTHYPDTGQVITNIWSEPITSQDLKDASSIAMHNILQQDEVVVSNLIAFDLIHQACRDQTVILDQSLRLRSLVLTSVALVSNYTMPLFYPQANHLDLIHNDLDFLMDKAYFSSSQPGDSYSLKFDIDDEEIFKLQPLTLQCLLLQFYIETSIMRVCDLSVRGSSNDASPISMSTFGDVLTVNPEKASQRWGFAKRNDVTSFSLVFVPSAVDMLKAYLDQLATNPDPAEGLELQLWTYECLRENLKCPLQANLCDIDFYADVMTAKQYQNLYPVVPTRAGLAGVMGSMDRVEFWTEYSQSQPNISSPIHQLQSTFDGILARSFIQSTYTSMLQSFEVENSDLVTALNLCLELDLTISLTDYLNLKTEKNRRGLDQDNRLKAETKFQRKFNRLIDYHFGKMAGQSDTNGTFYFKLYPSPLLLAHDTDLTGSESSKGSVKEEDEEPLALNHLLEHAVSPLFMRLKFTFNNPSLKVPTHEMVTSLIPTSYDVITENGVLDYSPESIGSEDSPLDSEHNVTAMIKMCLYIPRTLDQLLTNDSSLDQALNEISATSDPLKHPRIAELLPKAQVRALAETRSRLEWLIREEVIHGLITWHPITPSVLHWIDVNLSMRNPFMDFPSSFSIGLKFVDSERGQGYLIKELENMFISPYCIVRSGPYFYVQSRRPCKSQPEAPCPLPATSEDPTDLDLFGGLGISVADLEEVEGVTPNFWMVMVPKQDHIHILFFSRLFSGVERSRVIQRIRRKIAQLLRRVNQIILLNDLNQTRQCSKLLVPCDSVDDDYGSDNSHPSDDCDASSQAASGQTDFENISSFKSLALSDMEDGLNLQVGPPKFSLGQFQCPLLFTEVFPLHWRLKPMQALNHILATVMHPLAVSNRHNLYVINDAHSVFYLRLNEQECSLTLDLPDEGFMPRNVFMLASSENSTNVSLDRDHPGSIATDSSKNSYPASPSLKRPNSSSLLSHLRPPLSHYGQGSTPSLLDSRELILEVFGIAIPGKEVTEELPNLIHNRLTNHLTLNLISSYLARNATLKLTQADVNFIFPLKQHITPAGHFEYELPSYILNPMLAMLYIKQNVLQYLHLLSGNEARNQYKRFCSSKYHHQFGGSSECECFVGDFVFFYNCVASRNPTAVESALGQGIGLACLTLAETTTDQLVFEPKDKNHQHLGFRPLLTGEAFDIESIINHTSSLAATSKFKVMVDIWGRGNVDTKKLEYLVLDSIKQSMCDYAHDCCTRSFLMELPMGSDKKLMRAHSESDKLMMEPTLSIEDHALLSSVNIEHRLILPSTQILKFGHSISNPSMFLYDAKCSLTESAQRTVLAQLVDWLSDQHSQLSPSVLELSYLGHGEIIPTPRVMADWSQGGGNTLKAIKPHKYLLVSGLPDLPSKQSRPMHSFSSMPGPEMVTSRRSSTDDMISIKSGQARNLLRKERPIEDLQLYPTLGYPHQCTKTGNTKFELTRNHFVSITLDGSSLSLATFNMSKIFNDQAKNLIDRVLGWQRSRGSLLDFILQQKMGLFHQRYEVSGQLVPSPTNQPNQPDKPAHHKNLDLHRLGLLIRHLSPARLKSGAGLDLRAKPPGSIESHSIVDNASIQSGGDEVNRAEIHHHYPNIHKALFFTPPDSHSYGQEGERKILDHLQVHGQEFMAQYFKQMAGLSPELELANSAYIKLNELSSRNVENSIFPEPEGLLLLIQRAHLVHFCRTPLFRLNKDPTTRATKPELVFSDVIISSQSFQRWYRKVMDQLITHYGNYLTRLGLQFVGNGPEPYQPTSCPSVFYQTWRGERLALVSVKVVDMFVSIDMYLVPQLNTKSNPSKLILQQLSQLKAVIHGHSFIYDYHIHSLHNWITGQLSDIPDIPVLSVMNALAHSQFTKGAFSRNSITTGTLTTIEFDTRTIYQYILKTPTRYGVRNVYFNIKSKGFYIDDLSDSDRKGIVVVYMNDNDKAEGEDKFLRYFSLTVYNDEFQPFPSTGNNIETEETSENIIQTKLTEVIKLYHTDTLWRNLQATTQPITSSELNLLDQHFYQLDLLPLEPALHHPKSFNLSWPNLFNKLIKAFPNMNRSYFNPNGETQLILFNRLSSHHLIRFKYDSKISVEAIARDERDEIKKVELEHLSVVIRTIYYSVWCELDNPAGNKPN